MNQHVVNRFIHTVFSYITAACVILTIIPLLLVLLLVLPERMRVNNRLILLLLDLFYSGILGALFVPITLVGREHISNEPAIIVANHQSVIDVPMIGVLMDRRSHLWYALSYYARMPVLGFFIRRLGFSLDRESTQTAARDFLRGIRVIRGSTSHVIIFPEGTRHADGRVHDFMQGFALIARHTGRPVIPVYMPDNYQVYPPQSFWIRFHALRVTVGAPFGRDADESDERFTMRVRTWFLEQEAIHLRGG